MTHKTNGFTLKKRSTIDAMSKVTTKILDGFRRKKKTSTIFFNIKIVIDKINRNKTFEELEKMGIQGRMMDFIRELISKKCIKKGE